MSIKPGVKDILWMTFGAVVLLVVVLVALHFQRGQSPAELVAFKAKRVDLVERMRLSLASASEAEKSSVMAITDEDSQKYADQARAATAEVEQDRTQLGQLLATGGTANEQNLLAQFARDFTEFQRIDKELLALAVENTNLKAYSLAFGPAADAIKDMGAALARLEEKSAAAADARNVVLLASGVQIAALRIQSLLAPHIAEESDQKMDALEVQMSKEDREVRKDLDALAAMPVFKDDADLDTATSAYSRFDKLRTQILALSRENTNVRSLAISLNQKRKAMLVCQDALNALQQAILREPIPGVDYGSPSSPR